MATKNAQINLRLPAELDGWVGQRAGGSRHKAAYIRSLIERERAKAEELEMQAMFDSAWESLSPSERESERQKREVWVGGYAGRVE